jgi:uncharacterized protein YwgA
MSELFFSKTQEHALLALVIKEAQAAKSVGYFGRTALQKVVYFLKALGLPTRYQFEVHHYGHSAIRSTPISSSSWPTVWWLT